jgi:EAL domain-containing protein (putative c-di-GMP-specific phosphodiesterase class I)
VMKQLLAFQQAGIKISLDDFGTGYSSLSYLRKFDLDFLKIDKSFVYNLENDAANVALCEAIIVMAHKLNLKVIAEGVETQQQYDMLRRAGCDYGQGYLLGMPLPAREFEELLKRGTAGA